MSTKFEQLLDYLVNEEMDKANELFHEIVVEKSREIYENLIAEEEEEGQQDEAKDEQDESVEEDADEADESVEEGMDEEADESVEELEDSFELEADDEGDEHDFAPGDAADDLGADVMGGEEGEEAGEDAAMMDIKNAIQELEAAFAELEAAQGGEEAGDEFDMDADADSEFNADAEDETDEMMAPPSQPGMYEGKKRMTREYVEKVGNDWEKNSQKAQGKAAGADTGDKMGSPAEGKSPISSGKGKPTTGATAKNILGGAGGNEGGSNTGTSPNKVNKGLVPEKGEKFAGGLHNVDGVKSGVKSLSKVAGGHGAEKKGAAPGPVGSGTSDKAGQTSVGQVKSPINGAPNRNA